MGGDKTKEKKKAVEAPTSIASSNISTADAEAGAREKLLARKRKKSDASESKSSKNSCSSSTSNGKKNNEKESDSKKRDSPTKKDEKKDDKQDTSVQQEKKKSRSEHRRHGRQNSRMMNNRPPERGRDHPNNRGGFRDDFFHGDRRGPPPPGWGRGPPFRDDHHRGPPPRGAHFDPFGRAPPGAFRGRGPPHLPLGRNPFDHGRRPIPPGRRDRGGDGGPGPFPRDSPVQGRSISPPDYRGHRHRHECRHVRNHHGRRRSSSLRSQSRDSLSSHSSRSRSSSRSSYSSSSSSSRDSYSSYDDNDSRSISRSRSRSASPKNEEKQDRKQKETEKEAIKEAEEKSASSKSSSSRAKRDRSQSLNEESVGRRNHSRRRGRRRRRGRNRTDSHSSVSERSLSNSSRSFSSSSSRSRSRSSTASRSSNDDDEQNSHSSGSNEGSGGKRNKERRRKRRRHHSRRSSRHTENSALSKGQRTVFVSQLVMRTTERDLRKYFKKKVGCKVHDVSLIRDRRNTRNHKGCAYVEIGRIEDVSKALAVSGQPPDFQRFPILVKPSEADKNYIHPNSSGAAIVADVKGIANIDAGPGSMSAIAAVTPTESSFKNIGSNAMPNKKVLKNPLAFLPPLKDENGNRIEAQKVYVGGLDHAVTEQHLFALFSQYGTLLKVQLQLDLSTRLSRGYAFLAFHDPKVANLAIQNMAGKIFAGGRPLKTGWANQSSCFSSGRSIVTSEEFPDDAAALSQKALAVLSQMTGGTTDVHGPSSFANAGEQAPIPGVEKNTINNNSLTDPTNQAATAVELSKAMLVSSNHSTQSVDPSIIATAEDELDKAMGLMGAAPSVSSVPTVAEARARMAATVVARQLAVTAGLAVPSKLIGNVENPTRHLLVHNMYDKDEETDPGWEKDIEEEFTEECSNFGKITNVIVMHEEPGGKIYASFVDPLCAKACAEKLAGRWFDKRQLRVDYMKEENIPLVK